MPASLLGTSFIYNTATLSSPLPLSCLLPSSKQVLATAPLSAWAGPQKLPWREFLLV